MFIKLQARADRPPMKEVVDGLRKKLRGVAGINVFLLPTQNLRLGGRPRRSTSTSCKACRPASSMTGPASCRKGCAPTRCFATSPVIRNCAACRPACRSTGRANALGVCIDSLRSALVGQLQAVTVSFNLAPSVIASYGGDAAVFKNSQGSLAILIIGALLVIYELLGVLYESCIHPITILADLPSAAVGRCSRSSCSTLT